MTPEELAKIYWDSLELQRVEMSYLPGLGGPAQPFSDCHPTTQKMWTQAAQEVLDAQKSIQSCCSMASRAAAQNTELLHDMDCSSRCSEPCDLTKGHS